ncbi:hypothetical protein FOZ63_028071 [Perkinsus olseni]|uniref:Peptidase A1 domain-containing protein n=1 Tax=Perkinsus olseni TaxID=32597 RepID=A0A7J6TCB9_PEROL|nr:hypothetical protein FOZ63_028071 [Perkinsus olseni]KAF4695796.1 hypothetical protein FOZ60_003391 [Perkinsus olseni]KAF4742919.1 hypothetical protein FOZ62_025049 [Perkinsus olseni]
MWAAFAAMMFGTILHLLCEASDAPAKTVTIPVEEGFVAVNIDGQEVELKLDSGFWGLAVMDGRWYERKYGKGACDDPRAGCYFCSEKSPCEFNKGKLAPGLNFSDGKRIENINRTGTLVVGDREAANFTFVISRTRRWPTTVKPYGFFGISNLEPSFTVPHPWPGEESVLDSLLRLNVIGRRSYTLHTDGSRNSDRISGQLTLGDALDESKAGKHKFVDYAYNPEKHRAFAAVQVSSLRLFDAQGALLMKEGLVRRRPDSLLSMVDTGANGIYLPYPGLLKDIKSKLRMKLKKKGYTEKQINEMWREDQGPLVQVKEEALDSLPVLGFHLGEGDNSIPIRIHPKHYCVHTGDGDVIIFVQEYAMNLIGTPFFRAYSIHVDYTNNKIALLEN